MEAFWGVAYQMWVASVNWIGKFSYYYGLIIGAQIQPLKEFSMQESLIMFCPCLYTDAYLKDTDFSNHKE